jgi:serine phosphatase RsbU (regulator of sigma subunit)
VTAPVEHVPTSALEEAAEISGLGRSRLLRALGERDRLERVLLMLPGALSGLAPGPAAETIAKAVCELTGARFTMVILPELLLGAAVAGPDAGWVDNAFDPASVPLLRPALRGEPVRIPDTRALFADGASVAGPLRATADGRALRSLFVLPLQLGERTPGIVVLAHHRADAFSGRQVALVEALVRHLAQAIELYEAIIAESRIATALQESLLPPVLPAMPGVEIAARYRPSGSGNLVGGDFYDVFFDRAGGFYVLLGDASGVGPEAAGLAGIARYTARALAEPGPPPRDILSQINVALLRAAPEGRFCTAVLARFVPPGSESRPLNVSLGSAGHPPAYVMRQDGGVEASVSTTGALLGVFEDAAVGECDISLRPGDAVVFYTDGVTEARNPAGEQLAESGVAAVLRSAAGRSAEGVARRLERAVLDHRRPGRGDRRRPPAARVGALVIPAALPPGRKAAPEPRSSGTAARIASTAGTRTEQRGQRIGGGNDGGERAARLAVEQRDDEPSPGGLERFRDDARP